jgi:hypothetical protein
MSRLDGPNRPLGWKSDLYHPADTVLLGGSHHAALYDRFVVRGPCADGGRLRQRFGDRRCDRHRRKVGRRGRCDRWKRRWRSPERWRRQWARRKQCRRGYRRDCRRDVGIGWPDWRRRKHGQRGRHSGLWRKGRLGRNRWQWKPRLGRLCPRRRHGGRWQGRSRRRARWQRGRFWRDRRGWRHGQRRQHPARGKLRPGQQIDRLGRHLPHGSAQHVHRRDLGGRRTAE